MILAPATSWLAMPSRASVDANGSPVMGTALFKRHKMLPHPRDGRVLENPRYSTGDGRHTLTLNTNTSSVPSNSDTSSPHTLKHTSRRIGAPVLPPTPPTHSRQSSGNQSAITSTSKTQVPVAISRSSPSTPVAQHSPPTPDVTPPRSKPPLAFRPTAGDRYPSSASRTDSFKTARETPYASDEDEVSTIRPGLLSARPSENEIPQIERQSQRRKEVGLGLGLESDEGSRTPRAILGSQAEFVVFDGEWGSTREAEGACEVEREWDHNLMRNVIVRKRSGRGSYIPRKPTEVIERNTVLPTAATQVVRGLPLNERIAKHRLEKDENKARERIPLPNMAPHPAHSSSSEMRKVSSMSAGSSDVVEAFVVNGPPTRRKTLRHTKKYIGLRDISDQFLRTCASDPPETTQQREKLVYGKASIPERRHRSLVSNSTVKTTSTSSSASSRRQIINGGGIPVVVIPERRSSTHSRPPSLRSTSSRRTRRSMSLSSAPLSQSSKHNVPTFANPPPRKRTMSESASSGHSVRTIDFPPVVPKRRSSLSAPTSRNTSRAGSLTADSLKAHNMLQSLKHADSKLTTVPAQPTVGSQMAVSRGSETDVDLNGDPFFGNRLLAQVTPFSQISYETAGTAAEVSEALAVTLHPHQNRSLLLVQQQAPTQAPSKLVTGEPKIAINSTIPAISSQPAHPMDEVDSPLRNPRAPPEPPAFRFIPPTPATLDPNQEEEKQLGAGNQVPTLSENKASRSISLVRRAFSNRRRNSEPVIFGSGLMKRTFSLSSRHKQNMEDLHTPSISARSTNIYPSVEDRPADDSKLHPFWRPAHFWDDLEDHNSENDDEFGRYPIIDNRPSPKRSLSGRLKRTFAILPIKEDNGTYAVDRRMMHRTDSGKMRVTKRRSDLSLRRGAAGGSYRRELQHPETQFGYGFKEGNGGRVHTIPGLGVRVEYVGWSDMKRRLSERRRKERSDKLRATISNPREVQSGMDDVLRRRSEI